MAIGLQYTVFEGASMVALGDPIQFGAVAVGGGQLDSAPINGSNRIRRKVRVHTDTDCFVLWGESPTIAQDGTSGLSLTAEAEEYFDIESGHVIAVIERV